MTNENSYIFMIYVFYFLDFKSLIFLSMTNYIFESFTNKSF